MSSTTNENCAENGKISAHDQYTKAYVEILETYNEQLSNSVTQKSELKQDFFNVIKIIMYIMTVVFGIVLILSLVVMVVMVIFDNSSTQIMAGAIASVISSFVTMVVGIFELPRIVARYLFNKKEDELMNKIIQNIQKYELDADKEERLRAQASVDAAMTTILTQPCNDSEMKDSSYVDSSATSSELDVQVNNGA